MSDWIPHCLRYLTEAVPLSDPSPLYTCGAFQELALLAGVAMSFLWLRAAGRAERDRVWVLRRATVLAAIGFVAAMIGVALWVQGWNETVSLAEQVEAGTFSLLMMKGLLGVNSPVPLIVGMVTALIPLTSAFVLVRRLLRGAEGSSEVSGLEVAR